MADKYILSGRTPIKIDDAAAWGIWYEHADTQVDLTVIGDVKVSTIFTGLDYRMRPSTGPPLIFETRIFGGGEALHGETTRCSTWEQAEAQHAKAVALVRASLN